MKEGPDIAYIASLIGDPARSNILTALMAGKALTPSELANEAGITLQTVSFHLTKLEQGGLLEMRKQGRHRYYTLASPKVAQVLEALMGVAVEAGHLRTRTGPKDSALRKARVCYDHLAGEMGTDLFTRLIEKNLIVKQGEDIAITDQGITFAKAFGIDIEALQKSKPALCRECLDWSERRSHLAGSLGRAILAKILELRWAKRDKNTRAILFTTQGEEGFKNLL